MKSFYVGENSLGKTRYLKFSNNTNLLTLGIGKNALSFYEEGWTDYIESAEFYLESNLITHYLL